MSEDRFGELVEESDDSRPLPLPDPPRLGPFQREFWRSALRGRWLTSILGSALLPLLVICALTGLLSHAAYDPDLGSNDITGGFERGLFAFDWPTSPAWLYSLTQGLHIFSGLVAIPLLLAKLWSVIPRLFEHPPARSAAHALERLSIALLVGSALFLFATGVLNVQYWLPYPFAFVPAHYYAALVFIGAVAAHVVLKLPTVRRAFGEEGVLRPIAERDPERPDPEDDTLAATEPAAPTLSRRGMLAGVAGASVGVAALTAGQGLVPGLRDTALLSPRGQDYGSGPTDFQVNKTARSAGIDPATTRSGWRLELVGPEGTTRLSRSALQSMPQHTERLPIACVEGWTTWQTWSGVRLRDLRDMAGMDDAIALVESLQEGGAFRQATLNAGQVDDERSLLALRVNDVDLSLDHGFPARVIVPALPGVHNTKWVRKMTFSAA